MSSQVAPLQGRTSLKESRSCAAFVGPANSPNAGLATQYETSAHITHVSKRSRAFRSEPIRQIACIDQHDSRHGQCLLRAETPSAELPIQDTIGVRVIRLVFGDRCGSLELPCVRGLVEIAQTSVVPRH